MSAAAAFLAGAVAGGTAAAVLVRRAERSKAELRGRLFAFAMHEINTPVTAISMTVLNLLSEAFGEVPDALKPWLEMTREQVGRLGGLVGEARDFVHLDMQQDLRLAPTEADSREILEDALSGVRRGLEQAGAELKTETAAVLPRVRTDPERAARCLASVLFHARKFRKSGPIEVKASSADGRVRFEVFYEGAAMSREEVSASLDLYYPARRGKSQVLGATGMGLGLVRLVARAIGGDFQFNASEDGRALAALSFPAHEEKS